MRIAAMTAALAATALLGACATHDNMARSGYYTDAAATVPPPPPPLPPEPAYVPPPPPPPADYAPRAGERG